MVGKVQSTKAEKLEKAKSIIALNKFKDGDFECDDKDILDILSYYSITRNDAEIKEETNGVTI